MNGKREKGEVRLLDLLDLFAIGSVILSLDFLDNVFHLFGLPLPFFVAHLGLAFEEFFVWCPVAASNAVPECEKLSVVVVDCFVC